MELLRSEMTPERLQNELAQVVIITEQAKNLHEQLRILAREKKIRLGRIKRLENVVGKLPMPEPVVALVEPTSGPRKRRECATAINYGSQEMPDFLKTQATSAAKPKTEEEFVKDFAKKLKAEPVAQSAPAIMSNEEYERLYGHLPKE